MFNDKIVKWMPAFIFGTLMIIIYKTIDNYDLVVGFFCEFFSIISPFLVAILIVYFLYIPCKKLEELYKKSKYQFISTRSRAFGVGTVYLILLAVIILSIIFVIPIIFQSILDLASNIPAYSNYVLEWVDSLPEDSFINKESLMDAVNGIFTQLLDPAKMEQITQGVITAANTIINAVISLTVSLYILLDRENIAKTFDGLTKSLIAEKPRKTLYKYLHKINNVVFTFIASKGIDSIINLVFITTILLIFDVRYAVLLGIIAGIASFIPYLGSLMAAIFITLITLITGTPIQAFYVAICLTIFQQIDGNFIEPKIMGTTLKMSPILVIFAVIVGGAYFGIAGMFLAVPVAAILKQVFSEYVESKKEKEEPESTET